MLKFITVSNTQADDFQVSWGQPASRVRWTAVAHQNSTRHAGKQGSHPRVQASTQLDRQTVLQASIDDTFPIIAIGKQTKAFLLSSIMMATATSHQVAAAAQSGVVCLSWALLLNNDGIWWNEIDGISFSFISGCLEGMQGGESGCGVQGLEVWGKGRFKDWWW